MIARRLRSTRGRVFMVTLLTFLLIGAVLLNVMWFTGITDRMQDILERDLIAGEEARLRDELATTETAMPRNGQVRTIIVPAGSVAGYRSFDTEVQADEIPPDTDVSPTGLDPALFDTKVIYYPSLLQRGGWQVFDDFNGELVPIGPDASIALLAVTDDAVVGPFSVHEALRTAIPLGSLAFAVIFSLVAGSGLRPVRRMTREAASIEIGGLDQRLADPGTGDELHDLAITLNGMLDRVSQGVATERRFVADAAHELRSPIAASTALLEVSLASDEMDWRTAASSVLDEQRRLGALVDDLVLLARLDDAGANPSERVMFDDVVAAESSRPFTSTIEVVTLEPSAVDADRRSLDRVVRNLLSNADRHAATRIEVRLETTATECVLHVDDDGPGIPVADRTRVFERFARLDDARSRDEGGSGIGLAIVKQVTEAHRGTAQATPSPLGGARFTIKLPKADSESADGRNLATPSG